MKTVQCNEWLIEVDIDKTKQYYNTYKQKNNQANRNFAEYCKSLTAEEKSFFDAFGINPTCCEIEHIGADKKGDFPCGGYYLVCGKYLKYPPEEFTTIEELAKNNFYSFLEVRLCLNTEDLCLTAFGICNRFTKSKSLLMPFLCSASTNFIGT